MIEWTTTQEEAGLTASDWLQQRIPSAPRGYLRQLLKRGKIHRRGEPLVADAVLAAGEKVTLPDSARLRELLETVAEVLFESRELLVALKPAGLAVHLGVGHEHDNLTLRIERLLRGRGAPYSVAPVHRLDVGTSGPVLFAKGRRAAGELGKVFMTEGVEKLYLALVAGDLSGHGVLASPVPTKGKLKAAQTSYRVLGRGGGLCLLELRLHSGRTHQIRRHLADAGHPLAGDRRYGGPQLQGLARPFLHCCRLAFDDPFEHLRRTFEAPLPPELAAPLQAAGLPLPETTAP